MPKAKIIVFFVVFVEFSYVFCSITGNFVIFVLIP